MNAARWLDFGLRLLCGGGLALATYGVIAPVPSLRPGTQPVSVAPLPVPAARAEAGTFEQVWLTPLLTPGRAPDPSATPADAPLPATELGSYRLLGVVRKGAHAAALIATPGADQAELTEVNGAIGPWTVREIGHDSVLLEAAERTITLRLQAGNEPAVQRTGSIGEDLR